MCIAINRIIVDDSIYDPFVKDPAVRRAAGRRSRRCGHGDRPDHQPRAV
jgi:acyl-CoA reductase-like NAD-dependent aldehyde dehydrogenase